MGSVPLRRRAGRASIPPVRITQRAFDNRALDDMYIYIYIYIYMCVHIYVYIYTYIYIHT